MKEENNKNLYIIPGIIFSLIFISVFLMYYRVYVKKDFYYFTSEEEVESGIGLKIN